MLYTPSHAELGQHPKTRRLARLLGVSIPTAIGHLHLLWHFALKYAPDGDLTSFDDVDLAEGAMWEGGAQVFSAALHDAGFIDASAEGEPWAIRLHDWDDYGGKYIERRERNAERMREKRATGHYPMNTPRATHVQRTYARRAGLEERRGEESREEEKATPSLAAARPVRAAPKPKTLRDEDAGRFERWYAAYPRHEKRPDAERAWSKLLPDDALTGRLIADVEARVVGRKWAEGYIEQPATYLNQRVWEDDIEPVRTIRAGPSANGSEPAPPEYFRDLRRKLDAGKAGGR
jgi:hypothetical protein